MADSLRIDAEEYVAFAAKLKTMEPKIRNGVRKRIRESAKAFGPEIVREGAEPLPDRGGVEAYVVARGKSPTVAQTSTGVRLVLGKKKGPQIGRMNEGNLRHPVFGVWHKTKSGVSVKSQPHLRWTWKWVGQEVPAGSWTEAAEKHLPEMREAVRKEMESILKELG